ncbi:uncharacterized protein LOC143250232 [Tachypleus tridentatus]|uniref:uncharacterized protein LOC143250232 n=1 Tax=Tachypleus tridentatus TaxID=6853 RepID=UPI003FD1C491
MMKYIFVAALLATGIVAFPQTGTTVFGRRTNTFGGQLLPGQQQGQFGGQLRPGQQQGPFGGQLLSGQQQSPFGGQLRSRQQQVPFGGQQGFTGGQAIPTGQFDPSQFGLQSSQYRQFANLYPQRQLAG